MGDEEELRDLEARYCSYGDTAHYLDEPPVTVCLRIERFDTADPTAPVSVAGRRSVRVPKGTPWPRDAPPFPER